MKMEEQIEARTAEERASEIIDQFVPWRNLMTVSGDRDKLIKAIAEALAEALASVACGEAAAPSARLTYILTRNRHQAFNLLASAVRDSGLPQADIAKRAGLPPETLSYLLKRPRNIEIDTLSRIVGSAVDCAIAFQAVRKRKDGDSPTPTDAEERARELLVAWGAGTGASSSVSEMDMVRLEDAIADALAAERARADQLEEQVGVEHEMALILKAERDRLEELNSTVCEQRDLAERMHDIADQELRALKDELDRLPQSLTKSEERDDKTS